MPRVQKEQFVPVNPSSLKPAYSLILVNDHFIKGCRASFSARHTGQKDRVVLCRLALFQVFVFSVEFLI